MPPVISSRARGTNCGAIVYTGVKYELIFTGNASKLNERIQTDRSTYGRAYEVVQRYDEINMGVALPELRKVVDRLNLRTPRDEVNLEEALKNV